MAEKKTSIKLISSSHLGKLKLDLTTYATQRREIIKLSGDALHHAKRSIFALHRGNIDEAKQKIDSSLGLIKKLSVIIKKDKRLEKEGSYLAAIEELVEAVLFLRFVEKKEIGAIGEFSVPSTTYIAGLCDVPGELYRYAIKAATEKDLETVKRCAETGQLIVGELIEFNLTSYLRNKFDQAKRAVQKLEQIVYDLSLKD